MNHIRSLPLVRAPDAELKPAFLLSCGAEREGCIVHMQAHR